MHSTTNREDYSELNYRFSHSLGYNRVICRIDISEGKPSWTGKTSSDQDMQKKLLVIFASNMNFKTVFRLRRVFRPILLAV